MNTPAKNHPLNNDMLIIYFVGGITSYEFKLVKELFKEKEVAKNVKNNLKRDVEFKEISFYYHIFQGLDWQLSFL
jgi:hypothetical protein